MTRTTRILAAVVLAGAALLVAVAVGFEAGRRYPFEFLRKYLPTPGNAFWTVGEETPFPRYESAVATFGDSVYVFGGFHDLDLNASLAVQVLDASTGTWSRRGDMPTARTHLNAAVHGRSVWFAGGFVGQHPGLATNEVWRYDLETDQWTPGVPLPELRAAGALVVLGNRLHYFGGYLADRHSVSELHWQLDLDAPDSLRRWTAAAPLPVARGHASGAVIDGFAYVIGGAIGHDRYQMDLPDVHRYDPGSDSWTAVAPLPIPRSHFEPSTVIRQGRIVIIGGRSRSRGEEALADVTEYDPATNQWAALAPLPLGRSAPIAASIGDRLIVAAGAPRSALPVSRETWVGRFDSAWEPFPAMPTAIGEVAGGIIGDRLFMVGDSRETLAFDIRSGHWDPMVTNPQRISFGDHHAAEVFDGRLWLIGGLGGGEGEVQVYDPVTKRWAIGPRMPFATGSAATAVIGGMIYVAGGIVGDTTTRQAVRLDPATMTWTPIAPMPRGRNHVASGTDGARFYVFGGRGPGSGDRNVVANGYADVQVYDPATDRWTASDSGPGSPVAMPQARGGMGKAVFVDGEFWVFGGETLDGPGATKQNVYNRVDVYSPASNTWRAGPPMPTARHGIFPLLHGKRIIVAGGGTRAAYSISGVVEVLDTRRVGRP